MLRNSRTFVLKGLLSNHVYVPMCTFWLSTAGSLWLSSISCNQRDIYIHVRRSLCNFTFMWPCIVTNFFVIKPNRCTNFTNFILSWNSTCFGQFICPSSGVYSLYTQQWYISDRFVDSFRAGSGWNCSSILFLLGSCLRTPDDGQTKCPKHVEFHDKIKFVKLVHLVGFITKKIPYVN
jgi:hypothetical protein